MPLFNENGRFVEIGTTFVEYMTTAFLTEENMKLIKAIVKPHMLDNVKEALNGLGISGMTTYEVKGFGRQKGHHELYRGAEYQIDFVPKIMLETVVPDEIVAQAIGVISEAAKTGKIGDGKIFVLDIIEAVRIRTGETGNDSI